VEIKETDNGVYFINTLPIPFQIVEIDKLEGENNVFLGGLQDKPGKEKILELFKECSLNTKDSKIRKYLDIFLTIHREYLKTLKEDFINPETAELLKEIGFAQIWKTEGL
jgi:hypothetical protein